MKFAVRLLVLLAIFISSFYLCVSKAEASSATSHSSTMSIVAVDSGCPNEAPVGGESATHLSHSCHFGHCSFPLPSDAHVEVPIVSKKVHSPALLSILEAFQREEPEPPKA